MTKQEANPKPRITDVRVEDAKTGQPVQELRHLYSNGYRIRFTLHNDGAYPMKLVLRPYRSDRKKVLGSSVSVDVAAKSSRAYVISSFSVSEEEILQDSRTGFLLCYEDASQQLVRIPGGVFAYKVLPRETDRDNVRYGVKILKLKPDINTLVPTKAIYNHTLYYTYRVVGAQGKPVEGVTIECKRSDIEQMVVRSKPSDADGYLTLEVRAGDMALRAGDSYQLVFSKARHGGSDVMILQQEVEIPRVQLIPYRAEEIKLGIGTGKLKSWGSGWLPVSFDFGNKFVLDERDGWSHDGISAEMKFKAGLERSIVNKLPHGIAATELKVSGDLSLSLGMEMNNAGPAFLSYIALQGIHDAVATLIIGNSKQRFSEGFLGLCQSAIDNLAPTALKDIESKINLKLKGKLEAGTNIELGSWPMFLNMELLKFEGKAAAELQGGIKILPDGVARSIAIEGSASIGGGTAWPIFPEVSKEFSRKVGVSREYGWNGIDRSVTHTYGTSEKLSVVPPKFLRELEASLALDAALIKVKGAGLELERTAEIEVKTKVKGQLFDYMRNRTFSGDLNLANMTRDALFWGEPYTSNWICDYMTGVRVEYPQSEGSLKDFHRTKELQVSYKLTPKIERLEIFGSKHTDVKMELPIYGEFSMPNISNEYYHKQSNRIIKTDEYRDWKHLTQDLFDRYEVQTKGYILGAMCHVKDALGKVWDWASDLGVALAEKASQTVFEWFNKTREVLGDMRLSDALRANPQVDISHIYFSIPGDFKAFAEGTEYKFHYLYPAGEVTGVSRTDGEAFVVVSDIFYLRATDAAGEMIKAAPNGTFSVRPTLGADDLKVLGLPASVRASLYYLPIGADNNQWELLGPTEQSYQCRGLGNYAIGVKLSEDKESPTVTCVMDDGRGELKVIMEDNIGINWRSLSIVVNGVPRTYRRVGTKLEAYVSLSSGEYGQGVTPDIRVRVQDLSGNFGGYEQTASQRVELETPETMASELPICFPNPTAGGRVTLRLAEVWGSGRYILYDLSGHMLLEGLAYEGDTHIELPAHLQGMYYLRVVTPRGTHTIALLIK